MLNVNGVSMRFGIFCQAIYMFTEYPCVKMQKNEKSEQTHYVLHGKHKYKTNKKTICFAIIFAFLSSNMEHTAGGQTTEEKEER